MKLNKRQILTWISIILGAIFLYYLYFWIRSYVVPILTPFIIAAILAYLLNPLVNLLMKKRMHRIIALLIVYASGITALTLLIIYLVPRLIEELNRLTILLPRYTSQFQSLYLAAEEKLNNISWSEEVNQTIQRIYRQFDIFPQLTEKIQKLTQGIIGKLSGMLITIVKTIFNLVLAIILSFYLLKDLDKIKTRFTQILSPQYHKQVFHYLRDVNEVLAAFVRGQLIVCAIIGIVTFIGLTIMRIEFALLIAIVAGITNLIPYFGPIIGAIPGIIVGAMQSPWLGLKVLIFFVVVQQIDGNIVTPKIVGGKVGFHPVLVIFILLLGERWKGILGMLFAIPVAGVIKVTLRHIGILVTKNNEER